VSSEQITRLDFQVGPGDNRSRLDEFLFSKLTTLSKMYLRELVRTGSCEVNGAVENVGYRLRQNDFIEVAADMSRGTSMRPENIPLHVVFEDGHIAVINKPAGMLVHPTNRDKNGTLLNALAFHLNQETSNGRFVRPGLIHRLDKETSGLIVIAKTPRAHSTLCNFFMKKFVTKLYVARIEGVIEQDEGIIQSAIGRYAELKLWDVKPDGKHSITKFRVRERRDDSTLVELQPVTGRTNQLRIHCASIGHPIMGDVQRGGREFKRLCLHAEQLSFRHPATRDDVSFMVPANGFF
jgi:23S rRNA pseudouridine1911/1915/1917 synthase